MRERVCGGAAIGPCEVVRSLPNVASNADGGIYSSQQSGLGNAPSAGSASGVRPRPFPDSGGIGRAMRYELQVEVPAGVSAPSFIDKIPTGYLKRRSLKETYCQQTLLPTVPISCCVSVL